MKKIIFMMLAVSLFPLILQASPILWEVSSGGNGHYYEFINMGSYINRNDAFAAAQTRTYLGATGYLATVTTFTEHAFVNSQWAGSYSVWLGGAYQSGQWTWITGEAWSYQNWEPGQPDNQGSANGDFLLYYHAASNKSYWHDAYPNFTSVTGYVVEYNVLTTPEPAYLFLLGLGMIGYWISYKKQRKILLP